LETWEENDRTTLATKIEHGSVGEMETSDLLLLCRLSQQQALNSAILSLRAVTATTASGAATCTRPHVPPEKAGVNDTRHTDGLLSAPNLSAPSTPAPMITAAPTQKEFDDLKQVLADSLKNMEGMQKKLASSQPLVSTSDLSSDAASADALLRAEAAEGQLADLQKQIAALDISSD
jgi:hypothetical protein